MHTDKLWSTVNLDVIFREVTTSTEAKSPDESKVLIPHTGVGCKLCCRNL